MELSNTSQYAIRILSYIANNGTEKLISAKELSATLDIPYKFLTKIMTDLVKLEFILSIRGREGGFKLAREASSISIMDILNAFGILVEQERCILGIGDCAECDEKKRCILHDKWLKPKSLIKKMYENTTIENIQGIDFKQ